MTQKVNLYLELPQKGTVLLPFRRMLQIIQIFLLLLLLIYAVLYINKYFAVKQYNIALLNKQQIQAKLMTFKQQFTQLIDKGKSEAELVRLNNEVQVKTKVLEVLNKQSLSNMGGFSMYLTGLATHIQAGTWLNQIKFTDGAKNAKLMGKAIRTEDVLALMKNLMRDSIFSNQKLELAELTKPQQSGEPIVFVLSTKEASAK